MQNGDVDPLQELSEHAPGGIGCPPHPATGVSSSSNPRAILGVQLILGVQVWCHCGITLQASGLQASYVQGRQASSGNFLPASRTGDEYRQLVHCSVSQRERCVAPPFVWPCLALSGPLFCLDPFVWFLRLVRAFSAFIARIVSAHLHSAHPDRCMAWMQRVHAPPTSFDSETSVQDFWLRLVSAPCIWALCHGCLRQSWRGCYRRIRAPVGEPECASVTRLLSPTYSAPI